MNRMPGKDEVEKAPAAPEAPAAPRSRRLLSLFLRFFLAVALLAAGVAGWRWMMATAVRPGPRPARETAEPVRVLTVRLTSVRPLWTLYGQASAARRVALRMSVSGRVVETAAGLREGARVRKGQLLARVDDLAWRAAVEEAAAALAEAVAALRETRARLRLERLAVKNAREQLALAERDLSRAERLRRRGAMPDAAVDQRRLIAAQRRLALAQREANVEALAARAAQQQAAVTRREWTLKKARRNLADTVLLAPFDGRVAETHVEKGQQVSPSDRLVTLISDEPPEVRFALSERRYGALRAAGEKIVGRKVRIVWRTSGGRVRLDGEIVRVAAEIGEGRGAIRLFARPASGRRARWMPPGAFVEARMEGPLHPRAALLPEKAVYEGSRVYVLAAGRLRAVPVKLAGYARGMAVVEGLKGGERVVTSRLANPVSGRRAKVLGQ